MAVTRSMARRARTAPVAANPRIGMRRRRWIKRYKPSDVAHRHRLKDRQPKTETVTSYSRRT